MPESALRHEPAAGEIPLDIIDHLVGVFAERIPAGVLRGQPVGIVPPHAAKINHICDRILSPDPVSYFLSFFLFLFCHGFTSRGHFIIRFQIMQVGHLASLVHKRNFVCLCILVYNYSFSFLPSSDILIRKNEFLYLGWQLTWAWAWPCPLLSGPAVLTAFFFRSLCVHPAQVSRTPRALISLFSDFPFPFHVFPSLQNSYIFNPSIFTFLLIYMFTR